MVFCILSLVTRPIFCWRVFFAGWVAAGTAGSLVAAPLGFLVVICFFTLCGRSRRGWLRRGWLGWLDRRGRFRFVQRAAGLHLLGVAHVGHMLQQPRDILLQLWELA